jgi:hypothetical protein
VEGLIDHRVEATRTTPLDGAEQEV